MSVMDILVGIMCVVVVAALIMSFADGSDKTKGAETENTDTEKIRSKENKS